MRKLVVVISVACLALAACGPSGLAECPDVEGGFDLGSLQYGVRNKVKALLINPDSYRNENIFTRVAYAKERDDGTSYVSRVEVTFQAEDAAGWMAYGRATVDLRETSSGCKLGAARLYE